MGMIEWLEAAKRQLLEIDGERQIEWVNCKTQIAIADALVAIAEELRAIRMEIGNG